MKKILGIEKYAPGILVVRLEATKRKKIWLKKVKGSINSCDDHICPLYRECARLTSPLKKYPQFEGFCNHLFSEYPDLSNQLATKYGITSIHQVVPIKMKI